MSANNQNGRTEDDPAEEEDAWTQLLKRYRETFPDPARDPAAFQNGMAEILRRVQAMEGDDAE